MIFKLQLTVKACLVLEIFQLEVQTGKCERVVVNRVRLYVSVCVFVKKQFICTISFYVCSCHGANMAVVVWFCVLLKQRPISIWFICC